MMRSKRFEPIEEIASMAANDLSCAMGEAARRVAEFERQREQLEKYRAEYVRTTQRNGAVDAVRLQNHRSFLDRLTEALRQHVLKLDAARVEYEKRRSAWSAKRVEAESLNRVIARFRKEELHEAEKREQREGDDAAMRILQAHDEARSR